MKQYPSISHNPQRGLDVWVFGKLDGSQIRVEWDRKKGFHRWGRRNGLLDDSNPILTRAPEIWARMEEPEQIDSILRKQQVDQATLFMEFHGEHSFAGTHEEAEGQQLTLFDLDISRKGLLPPREFWDLFGSLPCTAPLLYQGNWTVDLEQQIRSGTLPGMPPEGVVAKALVRRQIVSWKFKTQAWYDRLRQHCGSDEARYRALA